jgi:phosphoglycolate phosphatase
MRRAFTDVLGRADMLDSFSFGGMTDQLIVRTAFERAAVTYEPMLRDKILEAYLAHLGDELPKATGYVVMPGVVPLLDSLITEPEYAIGLGTGNIEAGGRLKLGRADLNRYFPFGGFGSDAEDRAELLGHGAARGAAALGVPLGNCRVVVIGDTPRDVTAAHAIGAECVAVATGGIGADILAAAGAEVVVEDLTAPEARAAIVR